MLILGQQWALLSGNKLVNREFCSKNPPEKWQYQDNFFSLPNGVSADEESILGDFILEISVPSSGKKIYLLLAPWCKNIKSILSCLRAKAFTLACGINMHFGIVLPRTFFHHLENCVWNYSPGKKEYTAIKEVLFEREKLSLKCIQSLVLLMLIIRSRSFWRSMVCLFRLKGCKIMSRQNLSFEKNLSPVRPEFEPQMTESSQKFNPSIHRDHYYRFEKILTLLLTKFLLKRLTAL